MAETQLALPTDYDVVIAGAGMAGSLLALSIAKLEPSIQVLLLDAHAPRQLSSVATAVNPSFDARSIALSAGSVEILRRLALWADILPFAQAIEHIQVSDRGHFSCLELDSGDRAFGYVVGLREMGELLAKQLQECCNIKVCYHTSINNLVQHQSQVDCLLSDETKVTAKLLVGADGSHSQVRQLAKISSESVDYQRSAIIANVQVSQAHQGIAYERFCETGPIALLPLKDNLYSLVLCVDTKQIPFYKQLSDSEFLLQLQQQFGYRAGIFEAVGKRDIYPLSLMKTDQPIAHRVVCIGNAAHSLHPVAGQGFNLGLRDLYQLASTLSETTKQEIGDHTMLKAYWQVRQQDQVNTILMTDGLVRLFSNNNLLLSCARNMGLQMMSLLPFLSEPIVRQSKGLFSLSKKGSRV